MPEKRTLSKRMLSKRTLSKRTLEKHFFIVLSSALICIFLIVPRISSAVGRSVEFSSTLSQLEPADNKNNLIIASCLLSLLFLGVYKAQVNNMPELLKSQFEPKNLAVNFVCNYFMNIAATFFHELGHGLAKKALIGCDFKIHLGKNSADGGTPLFNSKYLSIDGLDPVAGFNTVASGSNKYSRLQKILINLSGGCAGMLGYCFIRAAIFLIYNFCNHENLSFTQNVKNAFLDAVALDQIVISQLFNMFVPMSFDGKLSGDAVAIWQAIGVKDSMIRSVADIQPYLMMLAFVALAFKQAESHVDDEHFVADKIFIGLSNYFLQGFFRFRSA